MHRIEYFHDGGIIFLHRNLKRVILPDGKTIDYITDENNRRIAKKVNGVVRKWTYEGLLRPVAEYDGQNNLIARYVYGTGVNVPEYMIKNGDTYRIITDHLGSVRMVVNVLTGEIIQKIDCDEYGVVKSDNNPQFTPFGFAGGLYDADTKLVRFGSRDYDAENGRWTSKDPIGFEGGDENLFRYVNNNPVNIFDPTGLKVVFGGSPTFNKKIKKIYARVKSTKHGSMMCSILEKRKDVYRIEPDWEESDYEFNTKKIRIDLNWHPEVEIEGGRKKSSSEGILAHEMGHALGEANEEINVQIHENPVTVELGEKARMKY